MDAIASPVYIDQSASALALTVLNGPPDARRFTILRAGTLFAGPVTVSAAIIGASHVLSFATPTRTLTEIFACTGAGAADRPLVFAPIADLLDADTRLALPDFTYRFRASMGDSGSVARLTRSLATGPDAVGLSFRFPPLGPDEPAAETLVLVRRSGNCLRADTAHCYARERRVVLTGSELTWRSRT
jgi:hypothetical protein